MSNKDKDEFLQSIAYFIGCVLVSGIILYILQHNGIPNGR